MSDVTKTPWDVRPISLSPRPPYLYAEALRCTLYLELICAGMGSLRMLDAYIESSTARVLISLTRFYLLSLLVKCVQLQF